MPLHLSGSFAGYGFSFLACRTESSEQHSYDEPEHGEPLTENVVQTMIAERFTRVFEIAEGRRQAMLTAGWCPEAAQACAAMVFASMVQSMGSGEYITM